MAKCSQCCQEMMDESVRSCTLQTVTFPAGDVLPAVPCDYERCRDCNVAEGGFHHPGCDKEECPKCKGQLISCGCLDDEDEDEDNF